MRRLTVGTRGSALALRQTDWIVNRLRTAFPTLDIRAEVIKTSGDRNLDVPLAKIGDKGLFVREIEAALLTGAIDFAVHSMKDLPTEIPTGLCIAAVPERVDPSDTLITSGATLNSLPPSARIGSSSLRRRSQILAYRPDLSVEDLRGNLDTRIRKFDEGFFDGIVLAWAGLDRMGWTSRVTERIPIDICVPAAGQGALAVEARDGDDEVLSYLRTLDHRIDRARVAAERSLLRALGGGCQIPIGACAYAEGDGLRLTGVVGAPDGSRAVRASASGDVSDPESLGKRLHDELMSGGAGAILRELNANGV